MTLAHTYKSEQYRRAIHFLLSWGWETNTQHTLWPPLQPVWSPGQFHPCGQTGPESDRLAGTRTSSDSGHNLPSNGCNSKTLGCGLETRTRGYLHRERISLCDFTAQEVRSNALLPSKHSTELAEVTFLLFCAKEPLQAFQVLHTVLFASRGVQHWRGCAISGSQTGAFCWSNAAGVGGGTRGWTVVQHLNNRGQRKSNFILSACSGRFWKTSEENYLLGRLKVWTHLSKRHSLGKRCSCAVWGWRVVERGTVPRDTARRELGTRAGCPRGAETQHTLALQRRQLGWNWSLLFLWFLGWRSLNTYKGTYNHMQVRGMCKLFGGQKCSPVFLRPRRRCCSGVRAIVEGAIVYLKYFQKSKTAFRLNRVANTSSVEDRKTYKTCL